MHTLVREKDLAKTTHVQRQLCWAHGSTEKGDTNAPEGPGVVSLRSRLASTWVDFWWPNVQNSILDTSAVGDLEARKPMEGLLSNPSLGLDVAWLQGSVCHIERNVPPKVVWCCGPAFLCLYSYRSVPQAFLCYIRPIASGTKWAKVGAREHGAGGGNCAVRAMVSDFCLLSCEGIHFSCLKPPSLWCLLASSGKQIPCKLIFYKGAKATQWSKNSLFHRQCWNNWVYIRQ